MDTLELKGLWQAYDAKLEKSLRLNIHLLEKIEGEKVQSSFSGVVRFKMIAVVVGILWTVFLGWLLYVYHTEPVFVGCVVLLMLFSATAIAAYIRQAIIIRQLNFSENLLETQRKLAVLHASLIRTTRIQFLQTPLYSFFWVTKGMFLHAGTQYWIIQGVITALFVVLTIWLYRNFTPKNKDKKWVKLLVKGEGGASIAKAVKFIKEIDAYKREL